MPDDKVVDEGKAIGEIVGRLQTRYSNLPPETVVAAVEQARESFGRAKVRDFVPVLIEKEANALLKAKG